MDTEDRDRYVAPLIQAWRQPMGLFFGGLRRQIEALTGELDTLRNTVAQAKTEAAEMSKELKQRDESIRREREGRKKTEQKVAKLTKGKQDSDQKQKDQNEKIEHLESELSLFRKSMLDARAESEALKSRLMKFEKIEVPEVSEETQGDEEGAAEKPEDGQDRAPRAMSPRQVDRRIERLEELLSQERDNRDDLRDRASRAEGGRRDADRRRVSEANKFEAVIRDLQHGLRSERRAYKVLQLQYEAQIERNRGLDQASGEEASQADAAPAEANEAAPASDAVEAVETQATESDNNPVETAEVETPIASDEDEKTEAEATPEG